MNTFTGTDIIVVHSGHRLYKEDGSDQFLEVLEGQAVRSGNCIYMVESDYIKLKDWLDKTGDA
jgi:hypothetical protein